MKLTLTYEEAIHCISEYYKGILPVFGNSEEFQIEILENPKKNPNNFSDVLHVSEAILPKSQDNSKNISKESEENPWLIPDEDGWFTHDPSWDSIKHPVYVNCNKAVTVMYGNDCFVGSRLPMYFDWRQSHPWSICKWKYAE